MWRTFTDWLASTPLSLAIQAANWAIPSIQTIHILAIAVVLSSMLMLNLRLLNIAWRGEAVSALVARFVRPVWLAVVVLLVTGALLIIAEPGRSLTNLVFLTKMSMLVCAIALTLFVQSAVRRRPVVWDAPRPHLGARVTAVLSLILWLSISVAGRLIAYGGAVR